LTGQRQDQLDWNIAGHLGGTNPNILSELQWDDIASRELSAGLELAWSLPRNIEVVLLGDAAYGWIYSGRNQDSDYAGDNRTIEWSRSVNDAGDGQLLDLRGGGGVRFHLGRKWTLTPMIGYAYHEQDLVMRDGLQTVVIIPAPAPYPDPFPVGTSFPDLNSSYNSWWFGPWVGGQASYEINEHLTADVDVRMYRINFQAEADWNLRSDLQHPVSFEHEADGSGMAINIGFDYRLNRHWSSGLQYDFIAMQADDGLDFIYVRSPTPGVGVTRLNEVNWGAWSLLLALRYSF